MQISRATITHPHCGYIFEASRSLTGNARQTLALTAPLRINHIVAIAILFIRVFEQVTSFSEKSAWMIPIRY